MVDQSIEGNDKSAMEWVLDADVERTALLAEEERLMDLLHSDNTSDLVIPDDLKGVNLEVALSECYERMDTIGVSSAETRAMKILLGLGFTNETMRTATNSLSGGWAMRAALASALYMHPDLLLLDEPTNHLDLHAILWLETWLLNEFEGSALIVSHDQCFLNSVCTDILELRTILSGYKKSSLTHYSGDYDSYQQTLAETKIAIRRQRAALELQKERLKEFVSREGRKYDGPAFQAQRKSKLKKLESLKESEPEDVEDDAEVYLELPEPNGVFDMHEKLITLHDVSFSWPGTPPKLLFEHVEFNVVPGARIGILGKNGSGKTCLVDILCGTLHPTSGRVSIHQGCVLTLLQQHHYKGDQLDPNLSPLDHLRELPFSDRTAIGTYDLGTRQEETMHRSYLADFGLVGARALIPVKFLSGGQKMRVAMAVALYKRPDVLILDEVS